MTSSATAVGNLRRQLILKYFKELSPELGCALAARGSQGGGASVAHGTSD